MNLLLACGSNYGKRLSLFHNSGRCTKTRNKLCYRLSCGDGACVTGPVGLDDGLVEGANLQRGGKEGRGLFFIINCSQ